MDGLDEATADAVKQTATDTRQRSTIAFPYMDLAAATALAEAIFKNVGAGDCDDSQLAAWSGQSSKSSTFRVQIYAARTFGLLTGDASHHTLTELGLAIVDAHRAREAKVRAFLTVPLYLGIFEKFKGGSLPPAAALEREIVAFGVAPKQKDRARQVFERAAEQAGFFAHGRDRLVQPGSSGQLAVERVENGNGGGGGGGGGEGVTGDPLIDAIVKKLPAAGSKWSRPEREIWAKMIDMAFDLAYGVEPKAT